MADAPLDRIPVFVKTGSVIPKKPFALSTEEQTGELTFNVYSGQDATFSLYEDAGDGYGYEKGEYQFTELKWIEQEQKFLVNGIEASRYVVHMIRPL